MRLMRVYQIGVLLCGILCPALALSQSYEITPSITVGERYDDNIDLDHENEEDDFITAISPGIVLRYAPSRDTDFNFEYRPTFEIFASETNNNNVAHRLSLDWTTALSRRVELSISDEFRITEEVEDRIREVTDEDGTRSESDTEREQTIRNVAEASLRFQLAPRSSIEMLFNNLIEDVEDPDEVDEIRYRLGAEFAYLTNVQRGNRALFGFTTDIFTFSANGEGSADDEDDFIVHTASVGYEHHLSPTLTATGRVGYSFTTGLDDDDGQDSGIVGGFDVVKQLRAGRASFGYLHSVSSGGGDGGQVLSDRIVGELTTNLSPKITAGLGTTAVRLDFQNERNQDDDRWFFTIRPRLTYQVLRTLRLSTSYIFSKTFFDESDEPDRTDHRVRVEARLFLRTALSVGLGYDYRTRSFESVDDIMNSREDDEFTRNQVFLNVTYGPTFRF